MDLSARISSAQEAGVLCSNPGRGRHRLVGFSPLVGPCSHKLCSLPIFCLRYSSEQISI